MSNFKRTKIFGRKEKLNLLVFIGLGLVLALVLYLSNTSTNSSNNQAEGNKTEVVDNSSTGAFDKELNVNENSIDNAIQVNEDKNENTNVNNNDLAMNNVNDKVESDDSKVNNSSDTIVNDIAKDNSQDLVSEQASDIAENDNLESSQVSSSSTISFSSPVDGSLIREYTTDTIYSKTLNTWRTREGIDLKAEKGTAVVSVLDGVVEKIDNDLTEKGQYIVIKHDDGFKSVYTNLDEEVKVVNGQKVRKGEIIATVGNSSGNYSNEEL